MPQIIRACGYLVYRREGGRILYLTLTNARHGDVGFPKGHALPAELERDTALRETLEETGIPADALRTKAHFRRVSSHGTAEGRKEVAYFLAETDCEEVALSKEHAEHAWADLDGTLGRLRHQNLRDLVRGAAIFLKDPILRRGLDPAAARALLGSTMGEGHPVLAHTAQVAGMARAIAAAWGGLDADYVEAAAWLHDVGRARSHGPRHPLEGFRLVVEAGHPGYAPPCISHFTKGCSATELARYPGADPELVREMSEACDLEAFPPEERIIALADSLAVGDRRGTIDEREADLVRRYGPSPLIAGNARIARGLLSEAETRAGRPLYPLLGIRSP
ncbi:MAG: NUDIX domain-containing protein [Planctomycetota bacterium]